MSSPKIIGGLLISFDIFEKKDIEKIEDKICALFSKEAENKKLNIGFFATKDSFQVNQSVWKIKIGDLISSLPEKKKADFSIKSESFEPFVDYVEIRGYNSPRLPFYVLMVRIIFKPDLFHLDQIKNELIHFSKPIRLFVDSLGGLTNEIVEFSPRSSVVSQFLVELSKEHFNEVWKNAIKYGQNLEKKEKITFSGKPRFELPSTFLLEQPFSLSDGCDNLSSLIIGGANVLFLIRQLFQLGFGGLRTPCLIQFCPTGESSKSNLAFSPSFFECVLDTFTFDNILFNGFSLLISLICFSIYLDYIASKRKKLERKISKLRDEISCLKGNEFDMHLEKINDYGTQLSSLLNMIGTISRQREVLLKQIANADSVVCIEIPIKNAIPEGFYPKNEGYLRIVANQILSTLKSTKESIKNQEGELRSLQTHISNIVNLKNIKSNKKLQNFTLFLTVFSIIITVIGLVIANNSYIIAQQSLKMDEWDFVASHPQGTYSVRIQQIGYDVSKDSDQFRISVQYLGTGESKYLTLELGFISGDSPILKSNTNLEVSSDRIIFARNYVDSSEGEVNFLVPRYENTTGSVGIVYYSSDVNVSIPEELYFSH